MDELNYAWQVRYTWTYDRDGYPADRHPLLTVPACPKPSTEKLAEDHRHVSTGWHQLFTRRRAALAGGGADEGSRFDRATNRQGVRSYQCGPGVEARTRSLTRLNTDSSSVMVCLAGRRVWAVIMAKMLLTEVGRAERVRTWWRWRKRRMRCENEMRNALMRLPRAFGKHYLTHSGCVCVCGLVAQPHIRGLFYDAA